MADPCLQMWPWAQAPEAYRALSEAGGDEDMVVWCPEGLTHARWPQALWDLLHDTHLVRAHVHGWGWLERHVVPGGVVLIVSHS